MRWIPPYQGLSQTNKFIPFPLYVLGTVTALFEET